ncbi:MAG: sulfatase, partial [Planctomycetota bacterium]
MLSKIPAVLGLRTSSSGTAPSAVARTLCVVTAYTTLAVTCVSEAGEATGDSRPNILMIAVDDLNYWSGHLGTNPDVKTPNIDRLAASGVSFRHAYTPAAICNATRCALLTGMRPSTTGVYANETDWRTVVGDGYSLPGWLRAHGYRTYGVGKLFHKAHIMRESDWDEYPQKPRYELPAGEPTSEGRTTRYSLGATRREDGNKFLEKGLEIAELAGGDDRSNDFHTAMYAAERLRSPGGEPFFIGCGIFRPHLPWSVPRFYFEMFPEPSVSTVPFFEDDLIDLPGRRNRPSPEFVRIRKSDQWKRAIRGYLASIAYADRQVGRVLDALEASPHRDDTIVVLWGDHGWHLGEKHRFRKFALWEEACRTTFVWRVPGVTPGGKIVDGPADVQGLWRTLAELIDVPAPPHVEGPSLVRVLKHPDDDRSETAVVTTQGFNNHAAEADGM